MRSPRRCSCFKTTVAILAVLSWLAQIVSLTSEEWIQARSMVRTVRQNSSSLNRSVFTETVLRSSLKFHCDVWVMCKENDWQLTTMTVTKLEQKSKALEKLHNHTVAKTDTTCSSIADGVFVMKELDIDIDIALNTSKAITKALAARGFSVSSLLLGSSGTIFLLLTHSRCVTAHSKQQLLYGGSSLFFVEGVFQAGAAVAGSLWMTEVTDSLPADIHLQTGWGFRITYSMVFVFITLSALSLLAGECEKYNRYTISYGYTSWDVKSELRAPLTESRL